MPITRRHFLQQGTAAADAMGLPANKLGKTPGITPG
jgi:hypothetical protein